MKKQQKRFIKLSQDLMFQAFFKRNSKCLVSLLKAFIPMPKGRTINKAYIIDPASLPNSPKGKLSIMDIKAQLENGELINIELQTFNQKRFRSRALYYWARILRSVRRKRSIHEIKPCLFPYFCRFRPF